VPGVDANFNRGGLDAAGLATPGAGFGGFVDLYFSYLYLLRY